MNKYSDNFLRDVRFFLSCRNVFTFSGGAELVKKTVKTTSFNKEGTKTGEYVYSLDKFVELFPSVGIKTSAPLFHLGTNIPASPSIIHKSEGYFTDYIHELIVEEMIQHDRLGVDGIEAFFHWESSGKIFPTRHPVLLRRLHNTKAAVNLQIEQWAQAMAEKILLPAEVSIRAQKEMLIDLRKRMGYREGITIADDLPEPEVSQIETLEWKVVDDIPVAHYSTEDLETKYNMPAWVANAVFEQRHKYDYAISLEKHGSITA